MVLFQDQLLLSPHYQSVDAVFRLVLSLRSTRLILVILLFTIQIQYIQRYKCDRPRSAFFAGTTSNNSSNNNEQDDLLERARQLREQARAMEDDLRKTPSRSSSTSSLISSATSTGTVEYTELANSVWTISYRFSSQPDPADDIRQDTKKESPKKFYTGKIQIRLKEDGYSEQLKSIPPPSDIQIAKVWGWDKETSNEDKQEYVLFSMDVKIPASDPNIPNQIERYYFQARVDNENVTNAKSVLQLRDGTITVKKDIAEQTNGRWGLFNVAGILSQFRYCGDFVAKASSP
jgi:hypothetical protein